MTVRKDMNSSQSKAILESFNQLTKPQKVGAWQRLGLGRVFVFVALAGSAIVFLTLVASKAHVIGIVGLVLAILLVVGLFYWPDQGTVLVIFVIYTNVAVVAYKFHGLPQILAASVSLLLCVPLAVYWFVRREQFVVDYTLLLMVSFLGALFASLMVSKSIPVGVEWITTFVLEGLALYFIIINVVRNIKTLRSVVWALLVAGSFLGSLTLLQELTHSYRNNFGGLAQRNTERWEGEEGSGGMIRQREKVRLANRAGGPIGGPNRYGQIMVVLLPLAFFRIMDEKNLGAKLAAGFCSILILSGMLLTYSRGAFMTLFVLIMIVTLMRYIKFYQVVAAAVVFLLIVTIASPGYMARMDTIKNIGALFTKDASVKADGATRGRVTEMLAAFNAFLDYPLVGVGPGQYSKYYSVEYMADPEIAFRQIDKTRRAHTLYFELAAETGLLGIITFMSIVFYVMYRLWRLRLHFVGKQPEITNIATGFLLSLICYLVSGIFLQLAYQRYYWLLVALSGATVIILEQLSEDATGSNDEAGLMVESGMRS